LISIIRELKNRGEASVPCNYSNHLKVTVPLPEV
jgi:hypothetical protein